MKKIIILIIIIIIFTGAGYWFYQSILKSEGENNEWKTYSNKEYGFEINYPNSWHSYKSEVGGLAEISTFSQTEYKKYYGTNDYEKLGEDWGVIHVYYIESNDIEKNIDGLERLIAALSKGSVSQIEDSTVEEIDVHGTKGYKISFSGKGYLLDENFSNIFYRFPNKNKEGILSFEGIFAGKNKEEYGKYAEIFEEMFLTFKFLQ